MSAVCHCIQWTSKVIAYTNKNSSIRCRTWRVVVGSQRNNLLQHVCLLVLGHTCTCIEIAVTEDLDSILGVFHFLEYLCTLEIPLKVIPVYINCNMIHKIKTGKTTDIYASVLFCYLFVCFHGIDQGLSHPCIGHTRSSTLSHSKNTIMKLDHPLWQY